MNPRLVGERFQGGTIPLEVLRDLAVLEEMVIEVAKWKFLRAHPDRRRSPRGFTDRIELQLTGVDQGSAIPKLALVLYSLVLPGLEEEKHYIDEAHEAIVAAIDAAGQGGEAVAHLPATALALFDKLGRSLKPDEAIEFTHPRGEGVARFDQGIRRRLAMESPGNRQLTDDVTLRGQIHEADQEARTFHLKLADGRKVKAPLDEAHRDAVLEAFAGYREEQWVEVRGIVQIDRNGRPVAFESLQRVDVLDSLDIRIQIDQLKTLKDGWFDGRGKAPAAADLDWLERWFEQALPLPQPLPYLYPTPEGGVRVEWSLDGHEASLEIDLNRRVGHWHCLDMASGMDEASDLVLDASGVVERLAERLLSFAGSDAR